MKILHIVPSYKPAYEYGGTIESVARLCEGLAGLGHEVCVFTTTANGKNELDVEVNCVHIVDGVDVIYHKRWAKDHIHISPALWKRLWRECSKYDVVHIHSWWNMLVLMAALICRLKKVKTIISPHGMLSEYILQHSNVQFKHYMHTTIGKPLLKYAVFHATSAAEYLECTQLIKGWKGFNLPNLVWLPRMDIAKRGNSRFTIIFLSRLHPKKGIELLMEAIAAMDEKPLLKMAGTGEESYVKELKERAATLGIEKNIQWLGWLNREQKFDELMQADLFALTSYNENFANVVMEALHVGTPVLVSEKVGLSDFVREHNLGWICGLDKKDISEKLNHAVACRLKREQINQCAPVMVGKYLDPKKVLEQYLVQYTS